MGYRPRDIVQLFFNQGLILGVLGGLVGLLIGFLICQAMGRVEVSSGRMASQDGKMIISYDLWIYVKAILIAISSAVFSSIWPARDAGKLEPMEIIRSGG
jgi:lipoprotein-releasing system permease protein